MSQEKNNIGIVTGSANKSSLENMATVSTIVSAALFTLACFAALGQIVKSEDQQSSRDSKVNQESTNEEKRDKRCV